jgi:hypothetical protein
MRKKEREGGREGEGEEGRDSKSSLRNHLVY